MTAYLDFDGLTRFKNKLDSANDVRYLKNDSIDSIIDNKLINIYRYKGSVASESLLPMEGNKVGDVYDVNNGMNYAWDGKKWDALGENKIIVDASLSSSSVNPVQNRVIYTELEKKAGLETASTSENGLMSSKDKGLLDGLVKNPVVVDTALSSTSENPVQNKVIKAALDKKAGTDLVSTSANGLMSFEDKKKLDDMGELTPISNDQIDNLFT